MNVDKISRFISDLLLSLKSLIKIVLLSRKDTITRANDNNDKIIVMGNGPSLTNTINNDFYALSTNPTLAVNFAANAPEFKKLRPRYYLIADPHFYSSCDNPAVNRLTQNLSSVNWEMTLFLPVKARHSALAHCNENIKIEYFNPIGIEGFNWLENFAFSHGWGMPRPRNVLIPAIMIGARLGYKQIFIAGADHSWMRTISVNDNNEVVSIQPHFYKDDESEQQRINIEYLKHPLHKIIHSFYIAFSAYHTIQRYATSCGIKIYNSTPESFIDAFPRAPLPKQ